MRSSVRWALFAFILALALPARSAKAQPAPAGSPAPPPVGQTENQPVDVDAKPPSTPVTLIDGPPKIEKRVEPVYPKTRLEAAHGPDERLPELDVEIEVHLDANGSVSKMKVLV